MGRPKISIISPVYNAEEYLETCISSCLNQTIDNIELIFVDDGSKDSSLEILRRIASEDSRLHVVSQKNGGASSARNRGLDEASGEFVFFIDADDYIPSETALEHLYLAAMDNDVKISGGSMCIDRDGALDFDSLHGRGLDSFSTAEVVEYSDYQYDYDFTRYIYSLDMLRENNIRFPNLVQFEDPVFFVRAMIAAGKFATIPDAVYAYRYAYKTTHWTEPMILDRLQGIMGLMQVSVDLRLPKLHAHLVQQLDAEMEGVLLANVENRTVMKKVYEANSLIDDSLLAEADPAHDGVYLMGVLDKTIRAYSQYTRIKGCAPGRFLLRLKRFFGL